MRVFFRDERGRRGLVVLREPRSGAVIEDPSLAQAIAAVRGMRRGMGPNGPVYGGEYEYDLPLGAELHRAMSDSEQWELAEAEGRSYLLRDPGDWVWMWADALLGPGEDRSALAARLAEHHLSRRGNAPR